MPDSPAYQYLFCFADEAVCLAEVKQSDLPSDAPPGKVYHWLYWDRRRGAMTRLLFKSMGEEGGQQVRRFEQGALRFDAARAVLTLEQPVFDGELAAVAVDAVPADLDAGVGAYLAQLD